MAELTLAPAPSAARSRRAGLVPLAALTVVAVATALLLVRARDASPAAALAPAAPKVTTPVGFRLPDVRDESATVAFSPTSGRPAVVNFFASWCEPCREELPTLESARQSLAGTVDFVGVDHTDGREPAADLLTASGVQFPAAFDPNGKVGAAYGLRGLPATVFITASGRVLEIHQGKLSRAALDRALSRLTLQAGRS